jgi:hypothetical protein
LRGGFAGYGTEYNEMGPKETEDFYDDFLQGQFFIGGRPALEEAIRVSCKQVARESFLGRGGGYGLRLHVFVKLDYI